MTLLSTFSNVKTYSPYILKVNFGFVDIKWLYLFEIKLIKWECFLFSGDCYVFIAYSIELAQTDLWRRGDGRKFSFRYFVIFCIVEAWIKEELFNEI